MKSFIKKLSLSLILTVFVFSFISIVSAQAVNTPVNLESVNCFADDLYEFQSVHVNVGTEKSSYKPGDIVTFNGQVENNNNYPVVDGNVFVRISKVKVDFEDNWHDAVDDFIAVEEINIDGLSTKPLSFSWQIPTGLGSGDYRADYFFSVGKKFNLGGLPFSNEVISGFSKFKIDSSQSTIFQFDRMGTEINGLVYQHIGTWPDVLADSSATITQPIVNYSDKEITVKVSYDLYFWDSLLPDDKISSKSETIIIPAKSSKIVTYKVDKVEESAYYLRIKAETSNSSALVNIRFVSSEIEKSRINYPALTVFPLREGEETKVFSCLHTLSMPMDGSKLNISLFDKEGEEVWSGVYNSDLTPMMAGAFGNFVAGEDTTYLKLKAELYDNSGLLQDSYENVYDCSTLNSEKCSEMLSLNLNLVKVYLLIALLILLVFILIVYRSVGLRNRKTSIIILSLITILVIISLVWLMAGNVNKIEAQSGGAASREQSGSVSRTWNVDLHSPGKYIAGNVTFTGGASLTGGEIQGDSFVTSIRDPLVVTYSSDCSWNFTGGYSDTPVCGVQGTMLDGPAGGTNTATLYATIYRSIGTITLVSGNNSVVLCDSNTTCRAVGEGETTITARAPVTFSGTGKGVGRLATNGPYSATFNPSNNGTVVITWKISVLAEPTCSDGIQNQNETGIDSGGVCSVTPPEIIASCNVSPNPAAIDQEVTWNAAITGTTTIPAFSWTGTDDLTGNTSSVKKTYSITGTKYATSTITVGAQTFIVACPGSVSSSGGSGGCTTNCGVTINPSGAVNGACGDPLIQNSCAAGSQLEDIDDTTADYVWLCKSTSGGTNATCSLPKSPVGSGFDCTVSMINPTSTPVNINTLTTWSVTPITLYGRDKRWYVKNGNGAETLITETTGADDNLLDWVLTTTGLKTVKVLIATGTPVTYQECSNTATTSVVITGGSSREI